MLVVGVVALVTAGASTVAGSPVTAAGANRPSPAALSKAGASGPPTVVRNGKVVAHDNPDWPADRLGG